ncbi:MAG TPA: tyrosine--tRNA ligase [Thermoanaerobaculia bacterium]|nr:tyrosine--tRNA ligase [Thermoanaerobaculia bacterium]
MQSQRQADDYDVLVKGCSHVIDEGDLKRKLARSRAEHRPLVVKVGFDPSAPDIHLGHTVLLHKMRHFQNAGHRVIFLIGDFTGLIGDPSGKKSTRPQLTRAEIEKNATTYAEQCFKVLDKDKTEIRYNSEWFLGGGKENRPPLGADGFVRLASRITVARVLERDDFQRRWNAHQPIALHELMYPLSQGYDSVALQADVELGGTDQLFNLLLGRDLMREEGMEPQVVMTVPLLVGTDGVEKMSKSLGNAIGVNEPPGDMYGKLMSISDETMWSYYLLLTDDLPGEIEEKKRSMHPMDAKKELARRIVGRFHGGEEAGRAAEEEFVRVFSKREEPARYEEIVLPASDAADPLPKLIAEAGLAPSNAEARRLIASGAVDVDDVRASDPKRAIPRTAGSEVRLRVGKRRFAKVIFRRTE